MPPDSIDKTSHSNSQVKNKTHLIQTQQTQSVILLVQRSRTHRLCFGFMLIFFFFNYASKMMKHRSVCISLHMHVSSSTDLKQK